MRARGVTFALSFALVAGGCSSPYSPPVHSDPQHASAALYLRRPLDRGFDLEATVQLPHVPFARGWYAAWFTYTREPNTAAPYPPFVQSGLIRLPQDGFALQPFIAYSTRSTAPALHVMPALGTGAHRIALALHSGTFVYSVDGKQTYRLPRSTAFGPERAGEYLQLGYELSASGDTAAASMREIRFSYGSRTRLEPLDPMAVPCIFTSNGVEWLVQPGELRAQGRFDAAVRDGGGCR